MMDSENNQSSIELQQSLTETNRLLKEFGPAWKRVIQYFSQNLPVPSHSTHINPTQEQACDCVGLQEHYKRSFKPKARILDCFYDLKDHVLVDIDPKEHQITLSFSMKQYGRSRQIFKDLCWYSSGWLLRQKNPTEFTFGFARVCDLKAIAWAVAIEYREIGYSCTIRCEGELISVDRILAEAQPSPIWTQLQEVPLCA
jgi:hypothetical protein